MHTVTVGQGFSNLSVPQGELEGLLKKDGWPCPQNFSFCKPGMGF